MKKKKNDSYANPCILRSIFFLLIFVIVSAGGRYGLKLDLHARDFEINL